MRCEVHTIQLYHRPPGPHSSLHLTVPPNHTAPNLTKPQIPHSPQQAIPTTSHSPSITQLNQNYTPPQDNCQHHKTPPAQNSSAPYRKTELNNTSQPPTSHRPSITQHSAAHSPPHYCHKDNQQYTDHNCHTAISTMLSPAAHSSQDHSAAWQNTAHWTVQSAVPHSSQHQAVTPKNTQTPAPDRSQHHGSTPAQNASAPHSCIAPQNICTTHLQDHKHSAPHSTQKHVIPRPHSMQHHTEPRNTQLTASQSRQTTPNHQHHRACWTTQLLVPQAPGQ